MPSSVQSVCNLLDPFGCNIAWKNWSLFEFSNGVSVFTVPLQELCWRHHATIWQIQGSLVSHLCALSSHVEQHELEQKGQGQVPEIIFKRNLNSIPLVSAIYKIQISNNHLVPQHPTGEGRFWCIHSKHSYELHNFMWAKEDDKKKKKQISKFSLLLNVDELSSNSLESSKQITS